MGDEKASGIRWAQWRTQSLIGMALDRPGQLEDMRDPDALTIIIWRLGVWVYTDKDSAIASYQQLMRDGHYPNIAWQVPRHIWDKLAPLVGEHATIYDGTWHSPLD